MSSTAGPNPAFSAASGDAMYDRIGWSAPPQVRLLESPLPHVRAIRHLGVATPGTVVATSQVDSERWDALLVNRGGEGWLEIRAGGRTNRGWQHREMIAFIPDGLDTHLEFPADSQALQLYVRPGILQGARDGRPGAGLRPILGERDRRVAWLMGLIEQELRSPGFGSSLLVEGLVGAISETLVATFVGREDEARDRITLTRAKLERVTDYIESRIAEAICLDDLAGVAGLSVYHFARMFKAATGDTPYQFLRRRRIALANRLLGEGAIPIAEVALRCGFANQAHFTAAFTRETGLSPGRYRRLARSG